MEDDYHLSTEAKA